MSIIKIVDKWNWYTQLIGAGCPDHMLSVAFFIANRVDGRPESDVYGKAYPEVAEISEATGKKADRVSAITKALHEQGWIIKDVNQRRTGRKTFYTLTIGEAWEAKTRAVSEKSLANLNPSRMESGEVTPIVSEQPTSNVSEEPSRMASDDKHKLQTSTETLSETSTRAERSPRGASLSSNRKTTSIDQRESDKLIGKEDVPSISDSFGVAKQGVSSQETGSLRDQTYARVLEFRKQQSELAAKKPVTPESADGMTQEEREEITW